MGRQQHAFNELVKFLDRKRAAKKKGMDIKLKLNEDTLEILDELLLMTEAESLFPIVSLLRLLLIDPFVSKRYTKDFMIINQILYKIGIPFEEEQELEEKENKEEYEEMQDMNLMDIHLLQFTAIGAVSHLYNGQDIDAMLDIDDNFINLGLNALNVKNCNVRLAASRLLFNIVYEIKRQYVFITNDTTDVTIDYSQKMEVLVKKLQKIINKINKYIHAKKEKHIPTLYRLLTIFGLVSYCDHNNKLTQELQINQDKIKQLNIAKELLSQNDDIQNLQNDLITVFA